MADTAVVEERSSQSLTLPAWGVVPVTVQLLLLVSASFVLPAAAHLAGLPVSQLRCPPVAMLCQMAGDAAQLAEVSREAGDPIGYLAARLSQNVIETSTSN